MKKTLIMLFTSAFFAGTAVAGEDTTFSSLDQDGNEAISAEEAAYSESLTEAWRAVDANDDGVVDRAEFSAFETMAPVSKD